MQEAEGLCIKDYLIVYEFLKKNDIFVNMGLDY